MTKRTLLLLGASLFAFSAAPVLAEQGQAGSDIQPQAQYQQDQSGQPGMTGEQPAASPGTGPAQAMQDHDQPAASPLHSRQVSEITGMTVVNEQGENLGNVRHIVLDPENRTPHAVIATGGVLGVGAREVVVPIEEFQLQDENLVLQGATQDQLENRTAFNEDQYERMSEDRTLSTVQ